MIGFEKLDHFFKHLVSHDFYWHLYKILYNFYNIMFTEGDCEVWFTCFPVCAVFFFWIKYLIFALAVGGCLSSLCIIISHIYIKTQPNYDSRTYFSVHPNCHHQMKFRYKNQMQNLIQKFITLCLMNTFFLFPFVLENILS